MILKIRIDDRLLHGQVAYSWKARLSYDAVVIADNQAANDELRKSTIKMCCPDGVKLAVREITKAQDLLKNEKLKAMKVFVICSNPKSAYELIQGLDEKPIINLGGMQNRAGAEFFSKAVYVTAEDLEYLDKINEMGYQMEVQEVPETSMTEYKTLRAKFSK
ncbi:MAG: PTS sugar transporter subunit IIB [Anaerorhabdus sp.]|uniref:PTS sugar transporter subunit IIB n=1 Tax=Anaerorhabdus sp. TaxID=1872524 RepID=UPI003A8C59A4